MELDDRVRALLLSDGGDAAATAAIEALGPGVLGYLRALLGEDDAHDAFSLFCEDLWRGLPGFRGESSLRAWAYRLAWHAVARFARDGYRARRQPLPSTAASRLAASVASRSGLAPGSRLDRLARLREQLTPEERTLLVLRVDRDLEWDEVVTVLATGGQAVNAPALRKRFERLTEKLARMAREQGLVE